MSNMYGVVKNVIESKSYDLTDILGKIETVWVQSRITDEQKLELIELARTNAMTSNSVDVLAKLADLDKRMKAVEELLNVLLESGNEDSEGENEGEPEDGGTEVTEPTYPEYEAGKWYYRGDKITFDGQNHICTAPEGIVCTWSPSEYPPYWEVYVEDLPIEEDAPLTE